MRDRALEAARRSRQQAESELFDLLKIPSVSSLSSHHPDVARAAAYVRDLLIGIGMDVEIHPGHPHPVVAAEWLGHSRGPTLTLYGHYDVQPPDPLNEWLTPPFEPTVQEGFVYARGATDNKGQMMAIIEAVKYAFQVGGPSLNIRFLIEGEEEITGRSLPDYVRANADRLASDFLLIADWPFTAPGLPNLITGLRGMLYTEIEVTGPNVDLHSGIYGGVAPNPFNSLAHILSRLKEPSGRITIPGLYQHVRPPTARELAAWAELPISEESLRREIGVAALEGEPDYSVHERRWGRPTLDVHGIVGGFTDEGSKTVIPAKAVAKVSMRLVPDQDPGVVFAGLRERVRELATPGVRVDVRKLGQSPAVLFGTDHPGLVAASKAFKLAFGSEPVLVRQGGSVPVALDFRDALHPHMIVTGFGLPEDRLHSPNERFSLDQYHRGTEMVLHLLWELAAG